MDVDCGTAVPGRRNKHIFLYHCIQGGVVRDTGSFELREFRNSQFTFTVDQPCFIRRCVPREADADSRERRWRTTYFPWATS